jgi:hypothetical protein
MECVVCPDVVLCAPCFGQQVDMGMCAIVSSAALLGYQLTYLLPADVLLSAGQLLPDERITLSSKLCPWDTHTRNMHLQP